MSKNRSKAQKKNDDSVAAKVKALIKEHQTPELEEYILLLEESKKELKRAVGLGPALEGSLPDYLSEFYPPYEKNFLYNLLKIGQNIKEKLQSDYGTTQIMIIFLGWTKLRPKRGTFGAKMEYMTPLS